MPMRENEQFEGYLKQFRPRNPQPLPRGTPQSRYRARFRLAAVCASAALVLATILVWFRLSSPWHQSEQSRSPDGRQSVTEIQPLTMGRANELLARSPSFQAALDGMVSPRPALTIPEHQHSAFDVLAEEKTQR